MSKLGSKEENRENLELRFHDGATNVRFLVDPGLILSEEDRKGIDVPFLDFKTILSATDYFSLANKLGQGGFGPVYKVTTLLYIANKLISCEKYCQIFNILSGKLT